MKDSTTTKIRALDADNTDIDIEKNTKFGIQHNLLGQGFPLLLYARMKHPEHADTGYICAGHVDALNLTLHSKCPAYKGPCPVAVLAHHAKPRARCAMVGAPGDLLNVLIDTKSIQIT